MAPAKGNAKGQRGVGQKSLTAQQSAPAATSKISRYDGYINDQRRVHNEAMADVNRLDIEIAELEQHLADLLEQRADAAAVQSLSADTINNAPKIIQGEGRPSPQITDRKDDGS